MSEDYAAVRRAYEDMRFSTEQLEMLRRAFQADLRRGRTRGRRCRLRLRVIAQLLEERRAASAK